MSIDTVVLDKSLKVTDSKILLKEIPSLLTNILIRKVRGRPVVKLEAD